MRGPNLDRRATDPFTTPRRSGIDGDRGANRSAYVVDITEPKVSSLVREAIATSSEPSGNDGRR